MNTTNDDFEFYNKEDIKFIENVLENLVVHYIIIILYPPYIRIPTPWRKDWFKELVTVIKKLRNDDYDNLSLLRNKLNDPDRFREGLAKFQQRLQNYLLKKT